jgi:hypothetical protein
MSQRSRAQSILKEAREILSQRLSEAVLEQAEEILADARGESYMSDIESLYDQVGMKLAHVSQMLANLPAEAAATTTTTAAAQHDPKETFTVATEAVPNADAVVQDTLPALVGPIHVAIPALPPPRSANSPRVRATQLSIQAFAAQIQAGDLHAAGRTLGALFELDDRRAVACAAVFAQRARSEAAFFRRLMQMRGDVQAGSVPKLVATLFDCFGLSQAEALEVLQVLRRRLRLEE